MGVDRFEDLRVWQEAKVLSDEVGRVLKGSALRTDFALGDQLNPSLRTKDYFKHLDLGLPAPKRHQPE